MATSLSLSPIPSAFLSSLTWAHRADAESAPRPACGCKCPRFWSSQSVSSLPPSTLTVIWQDNNRMKFTQRFSSCGTIQMQLSRLSLCFPPSGTNLRLEVRLLRSSQNISRGDVEVKQDLSKWGPIPGFALPLNQQQAGKMVDSNSEN